MAHDHGSGHHHSHAHDGTGNEARLRLAALLTGGFMLAEAVGGVLSGSLALLADAGHMLTDAASLSLAWFALHIAKRPSDGRRTYGFHRFQVLAAFTNGITLVFIALAIVWEAVRRLLWEPVEVAGGLMLVIAVIGLAVNIAAFLVLHGAERENLNIRGALLHVLGDLLGSIAAIAAALVILWTGWTPIDPLLSMAVAALIAYSAWFVIAESGHILLEAAPRNLDVAGMRDDIVASIAGVEDVHHVHAWSLTQERPMVTLHARIADMSRASEISALIKTRLRQRYRIDHATVEIECERCADHSGSHSPTAEVGH